MTITLRRVGVEACLPVRHAVLWPDLPPEASRVPDDDDALHYAAFAGDVIVGCGSFFTLDAQRVRLRKMAVLPDWQGRGIGRALILHAAADLRAAGYARLVLDARTTATGFYATLGLACVGDVFVKQGLDYLRMEGALPGGVSPRET